MAARFTKPVFFCNTTVFRAGLSKHHRTARELYVGYYKKYTGRASVTWAETVAEALCFGWIYGIRLSVDGDAYMVRFTPRRTGRLWSANNIRLVGELELEGRMTPAGRAAFDARRHKTGPKAAGYSTRGRTAEWDPALLRIFQAKRRAWRFFEAQPPGYRNTAAWWIMTAQREETKTRRLAKLMAACAAGKRLR